jgi:hypothetical protein
MGNLVKRLTLGAVVTFSSLFAHSQTVPKPIFIRAKCDGNISSIVLSSLRGTTNASPNYRLVLSLDDNGRLDIVQTIYMTCVENKDVTAIATQFGIAKCKSATVCHSVIDGMSLNATLCNANLSADCGRALFKVFDAYINRPNPSPLNVE